MGKKNGSKKKHTRIDDFFDEPVMNPFDDYQESTFEMHLLGDLINSSGAELDFGSDAMAGLQTDAAFPSWHLQKEPPIPQKEEPAPVPQPSKQPNRSYKGDEQAMYEYDIAIHLATNFSTGIYQGIPYLKKEGVDEALTIQMIGPLMIESMPTRMTRKVSAASFKHIQAWLRSILTTQGRTLHRDPALILFENGCFDLRDGRQVPESQLTNTFFPVRIHASYYPDQEPDTPVFDAFLEDCSGGDPAIKQLMLEFLGYMLAPCPPDTITLMADTAGSGKSVLGHLARQLLGFNKTCAIALSNFSKSFEVSQIFGKVGNFCLDISSAVLSDATVATIKRLTGGTDPETINAKYEQPFTYNNLAKLVFSCNEGGIRLRNPDSGFERRLVVIPFLHAVPRDRMDKRLPEKLWAERDGIVWHAMKALRQLHYRNYVFTYCHEGELLKRKYMGVAEASVQDFIDECCKLTPDEQEWTSEMYNAYLAHCRESGAYPVGRKRFSQMIYSIPGVHAQKFQKDHTQLQGARGISLR